jgi:hypothetical protein
MPRPAREGEERLCYGAFKSQRVDTKWPVWTPCSSRFWSSTWKARGRPERSEHNARRRARRSVDDMLVGGQAKARNLNRTP